MEDKNKGRLLKAVPIDEIKVAVDYCLDHCPTPDDDWVRDSSYLKYWKKDALAILAVHWPCVRYALTAAGGAGSRVVAIYPRSWIETLYKQLDLKEGKYAAYYPHQMWFHPDWKGTLAPAIGTSCWFTTTPAGGKFSGNIRGFDRWMHADVMHIPSGRIYSALPQIVMPQQGGVK